MRCRATTVPNASHNDYFAGTFLIEIVSFDVPPGTVPFTTTDPSRATGRSSPRTAHDESSVVPENGKLIPWQTSVSVRIGPGSNVNRTKTRVGSSGSAGP